MGEMAPNANKKSQQLGMACGTACNRLRKLILFDFVQRLELDYCYRCGDQIVSVKQLTIEHKQPWLDIDPDLFWDLDNIAFSHAKCNRPHPRRTSARRDANGQWLCLDCGEHKSVENYTTYSASHRSAGLPKSHCKPCRAKRERLGRPF